MKRLVIFAVIIVLFSIVWQNNRVYAASITITDSSDTIANNGLCSLPEAIINANNDNQSGSTDCMVGTGVDTITLTNDIDVMGTNIVSNSGPNAFPIINSIIRIEGDG